MKKIPDGLGVVGYGLRVLPPSTQNHPVPTNGATMQKSIADQLKFLYPINPIKVRNFLKGKGIKNADQLNYHFTIVALANLIVKEIQKRCKCQHSTPVEYFLYELPHNPTYPDPPDQLVLSGYRTNVRTYNQYPFGFAASYLLDERSQALIGEKAVTVFDAQLLHDDTGTYQIQIPDRQLQFDFNAPVAGKKGVVKPQPLTLEMSRGEHLGNVLKVFSKKHKAEFVTLTPEGITSENAATPYPKGVTAKGTGTARIRTECLWRLLGDTPPEPSFPIAYKSRFAPADPVRATVHPTGLGKDYTKITVNGTVKIQSGSFIATLP